MAVRANPERTSPTDSEIEARVVSAMESIEKLERHIDDAGFVPATQQHRGQIILALFSKALTVGRAICALVRAGFGEEAFGLSRTLFDIYFDVRYISNKDTEPRAEKFAMFFTKDIEGWRKIVPRYYPQIKMVETEGTKEILQIAENYSNPHEWSGEPYKTRSLAQEPDTYEFDSTGEPTTALFDYEVFYKFTSHFVHSTVCALESHITARGDIFTIRARWKPYSNRKAHLAVFNVLTMISKIFICGYRALGYDQPEEILEEMHVKMQAP